MSEHADVIRRYFHGRTGREQAEVALDALLAEREQVIEALREIRDISEQEETDYDQACDRIHNISDTALAKLGELAHDLPSELQ